MENVLKKKDAAFRNTEIFEHGAVLYLTIGLLHYRTYNLCKQKESKQMDSAVFPAC